MRRKKSRVQGIADQAMERATPVLDEAKERLAPYVDEARTQANEKLIPAMSTAADNARSTYNEKVGPQIGAALATATTASEPYREEARRRGAAALAAAKGEVEAPSPKKSHKLRNLLLLLGLGGLVAYAVKYFQEDDSAAWESDYPATGPTAVPDPSDPVSPVEATDGFGAGGAGGGTGDAGAASPDVALADADEHPHRPTDPDNPLERKDL